MVVIRQLREQDAAALREFLERLSPASRYARFQYVVKEVSPQLLRLLLEADPRTHLLLGAFDRDTLIGEARYVRREDPDEADFAIAVDDGWRRRGLANRLMIELVRHAGRSGVQRLKGEVLASNEAMLAFAAQQGFRVHPHFEDARLMRVRGEIQPGEPQPARSHPRSADTARFAIGAGFG
jgi:acetyltransferase